MYTKKASKINIAIPFTGYFSLNHRLGTTKMQLEIFTVKHYLKNIYII